jgi:Cu/Ag efflux protein CusF
MKTLLLASLFLAALPSVRAADRGDAATPTPAQAADAAPQTHPLRGVVTGVLPDKGALLVKHEEIPGVMRAMTMMFKVEPEVLARVKQGDAIKARMSRRDDGWWLSEVEVVPAAKG